MMCRVARMQPDQRRAGLHELPGALRVNTQAKLPVRRTRFAAAYLQTFQRGIGTE